MSKNNTTAISQDGLRYKSKQGGSLFGESSSMGTMSCYKCGLHKSRALGSFKKLLGQSMFVCGQCKPVANGCLMRPHFGHSIQKVTGL